MSVPIKVGV